MCTSEREILSFVRLSICMSVYMSACVGWVLNATVRIHASTHVCHAHRYLALNGNQLTSVQAGVFNGLTSLG